MAGGCRQKRGRGRGLEAIKGAGHGLQVRGGRATGKQEREGAGVPGDALVVLVVGDGVLDSTASLLLQQRVLRKDVCGTRHL